MGVCVRDGRCEGRKRCISVIRIYVRVELKKKNSTVEQMICIQENLYANLRAQNGSPFKNFMKNEPFEE